MAVDDQRPSAGVEFSRSAGSTSDNSTDRTTQRRKKRNSHRAALRRNTLSPAAPLNTDLKPGRITPNGNQRLYRPATNPKLLAADCSGFRITISQRLTCAHQEFAKHVLSATKLTAAPEIISGRVLNEFFVAGRK